MIRGGVGPWQIEWLGAPRGDLGEIQVRVKGPGGEKSLSVRWRRDAQGLWLELPDGVRGFDLSCELDDEGKRLWSALERGGAGEWEGLQWTRGEAAASAGAASGKKKALRIRAQMPGKILRVHVQSGATVEKGQPLAVIEAMKMENELRAPHAGRVGQVKVTEGQAVETGADLFTLEAT